MSKTLREQLVGAWRLVSYVEKDDKVLHLGTDKEMEFAAGTKTASLIWHRAEPNC